jgi:hypothetical protein
MGDQKPSKGTDPKRVQPGNDDELSDESLESVAGGCQWGCSNMDSCMSPLTGGDKGPIKGIQPIGID